MEANILTSSGKRDIELKRLKETERKSIQRQKKKLLQKSVQAEKDEAQGSFRSVQSLGKATQKIKRVLPKSPSKKLTVVKKLILDEFPQLKPSPFLRLKKAAVTPPEIDKLVKEFYARDDVSRQAPAKAV